MGSARRLRPSTARAGAARECGACGSPSPGATVVAAFTVDSGTEMLVFSSAGNIVRMGVDEISEQGRDATGVRVARLDEGDTVVAVAPVLEAEPTRRRSMAYLPRRQGDAAPASLGATPNAEAIVSEHGSSRAKSTDPWLVPKPCSRAFPPTGFGRIEQKKPKTSSASNGASPRRNRCSSVATCKPSVGRPVVGAQGLDLLLPLRVDRRCSLRA